MSCEVNFYQCDDLIIKSLAPILLKILDEKKKVLIFTNDEAKIKELDGALWTYGRSKFIPHITIFDEDFDLKRQPILISNKQENSNEADYLVFLNEVIPNFVNNFKRAFFLFDENNIAEAKLIAKAIKPKNSYKKENLKWTKFSF